jgi:hypothetical protein
MVKEDAIIVVGMVIVIIVSIIGVSWLIGLDAPQEQEEKTSLITERNTTDAGKEENESCVVAPEMTEKPLVMVHQRGYHQFLWSAEDLVELTPDDRQAIRSFLKQEFEIEVNFSSTKGKLRGVNRIDSDYVFYSNSDSSKRGIVWSQKDVRAESETIRFFAQTQIKGSDGRYVFVNWDDFIVTVNINNPGVSFIDVSGGDGGSSGSPGGGGSSEEGPSPSPPIGGELPPSPPIGEGPSPSPPIGGGPSPPPSV